MERLGEFVGLTFDREMLRPAIGNSHNVFGNRMRFEPGKLAQVRYDHHWFRSTEWVAPALLFPHVMKHNSLLYEHHGCVTAELRTRVVQGGGKSA